MSEGEIAELIMMNVDQIQAEHEFWLTISFGDEEDPLGGSGH